MSASTGLDLVPPGVLQRAVDRAYFLKDLTQHVAMSDENLLSTTEVYLRNLGRLDLDSEYNLDADAQLRHVLVPELGERIRPGSRLPLRRISTTLAEYDSSPDRKPFWYKSSFWSEECHARLREAAELLRAEIQHVSSLDAKALAEQVRFAIVGSRTARSWPACAPVYEPGFTYRLVPALAQRVLSRAAGATGVDTSLTGTVR